MSASAFFSMCPRVEHQRVNFDLRLMEVQMQRTQLLFILHKWIDIYKNGPGNLIM